MTTVEVSMPAVRATPAPYAGPERRRFAEPIDDVPSGKQMPPGWVSATEAAPLQCDRSHMLDDVQEAVSAVLCADAPLFDLIRHRVFLRCVGRPWLGAAAAAEVERLLAIDIVQRHVLACDKRRRLQRDLVALAETLRGAVPGN